MGTNSGTRVLACSSSSDTGSGRSGPGSNVAWLSRGTLARASLPLALHSASLGAGRSIPGAPPTRIPLPSAILGHLPDTSPHPRPAPRLRPPGCSSHRRRSGPTVQGRVAVGHTASGYPGAFPAPLTGVTMAGSRCASPARTRVVTTGRAPVAGQDEGRPVTVDHEDRSAADGSGPPASPDPAPGTSRRARVGASIGRLADAIRRGDDKAVEQAVLQLSQRSRWLAPLGMIVGAFLMLFQGVKLLYTNWRLALVQIVPAMWIWIAMLDIKLHVLHGKQFHVIRGPLLIPCFVGGHRAHRGQLLPERGLRLRHLGARSAEDPPCVRLGQGPPPRSFWPGAAPSAWRCPSPP